MAKTENKVQFNIKNVHYAVMTADGETPTWENPVPVPGAVNLSLEASGEITPFYADGVVYYKSSSNNGYEGDLEMARFIDKMLQDVWGYELNATDKTIIENVGVEPKSFALLFQIDGDADNDLYCMYNCTGTRPGIVGATSTDTKEPQTQLVAVTPIVNYSGEQIVQIGSDENARRYAVYRTYLDPDNDSIELYLERKAGVARGAENPVTGA